jgi:tRNA A-37 threonylcarbamoyl transferase component Bud32
VCEATIPDDAPEGLCPKCVLGRCLKVPESPVLSPRVGETTPYGGPPAAPVPAELATKFAGLEILELLGQGGMGAVYKARQTKLDRLVAVKVLPPEWGKDPAFAERFAREAKALARLNHPHVVAVHDFGESDGLFYLVMEYVDGANLRNILANGGLEPQEALAIVPQICDALQYAHEEGIVHRDIKPENILLDSKVRVKIADFGLAKLTNRPRATFTLTGSQQIMGTLDYMAPEQRIRPQEVDHRADIYSLGVVFYEMLTGELPLGRFGPPSQKPGVDVRLDRIVFRALEREPQQRYQRISEVKADLQRVSERSAAKSLGVAAGGGWMAQPSGCAIKRQAQRVEFGLGGPGSRYRGLLHLERNALILEWKGGLTVEWKRGVHEAPLEERTIPLEYVHSLELQKGWLVNYLILRTVRMKALEGIPTSSGGTVVLSLSRRYVQPAEALMEHVRGKISGPDADRSLELLPGTGMVDQTGQDRLPRDAADHRNDQPNPPGPVGRKLRSLFNSVYTMFFSRAKNVEAPTSDPSHEPSRSKS